MRPADKKETEKDLCELIAVVAGFMNELPTMDTREILISMNLVVELATELRNNVHNREVV
jgi:hypothetical protein